ncbi:phospholipid phosphatase 4 isoform X4 [Sagmatias obliquidens]|uniref:Phospholipid phosphatase 4 isoform X3 n=1 Tax=Tursiops truncatus TaxID=9739 RepID=A0A6J3Q6T0_TURTR|nr:phospholipid phosphatase 4 isoform X4 [Lagenorhynchus obliquidens]XP_030695206.1 phospholipid phosphatase 4 isoform X4 [Globicephala melas]XP_033697822.1 phospholipid phosphatase 4 isoform X3 [Tursiops truncatus]XP_059889516.1 phospholipid phosphatase 4 isoform X4 [Delphinus delphis]
MRELAIEIGVRALLFGVFVFTEFLDPFQRVIQPEEIWLYKNPLVQSDNIPTRLMFILLLVESLASFLPTFATDSTTRLWPTQLVTNPTSVYESRRR